MSLLLSNRKSDFYGMVVLLPIDGCSIFFLLLTIQDVMSTKVYVHVLRRNLHRNGLVEGVTEKEYSF